MPEIVLMPLAFFIKRELFYKNSGGACNSPRLLHQYALHPLHNTTIFLEILKCLRFNNFITPSRPSLNLLTTLAVEHPF